MAFEREQSTTGTEPSISVGSYVRTLITEDIQSRQSDGTGDTNLDAHDDQIVAILQRSAQYAHLSPADLRLLVAQERQKLRQEAEEARSDEEAEVAADIATEAKEAEGGYSGKGEPSFTEKLFGYDDYGNYGNDATAGGYDEDSNAGGSETAEDRSPPVDARETAVAAADEPAAVQPEAETAVAANTPPVSPDSPATPETAVASAGAEADTPRTPSEPEAPAVAAAPSPAAPTVEASVEAPPVIPPAPTKPIVAAYQQPTEARNLPEARDLPPAQSLPSAMYAALAQASAQGVSRESTGPSTDVPNEFVPPSAARGNTPSTGLAAAMA